MMPVKKRVSKQRNYKITDEAVMLFATSMAIQASGANEEWEDAGGRHREYLDAEHRLCWEILKLPPWHVSPTNSGLDGPMPDYMRGSCAAGTWDDAKEMRAELKKLARRL